MIPKDFEFKLFPNVDCRLHVLLVYFYRYHADSQLIVYNMHEMKGRIGQSLTLT